MSQDAEHDRPRYRLRGHRPEQTLLYQIIDQHYPDFLSAMEAQGRPLPGYVQDEFEAFLQCSRLEQGVATHRHGFQKLVADVALGQVGMVMGLEISRLARNNADFQQLLQLCGTSNTLIYDADALYDLMCLNDRLVLGSDSAHP